MKRKKEIKRGDLKIKDLYTAGWIISTMYIDLQEWLKDSKNKGNSPKVSLFK